MPTTVIARFSVLRVYAWTAFGLFIFGLLIGNWLRHPSGVSLQAHLLSRDFLGDPETIIGIVALSFLIVVLSVTLRQVIFRDQAAIWISNDELFFLNFYAAVTYSRLPTRDIEKFFVGSNFFLRPRGVIAKTTNGVKRFIPTLLLSEPAEVIASRLTDAVLKV